MFEHKGEKEICNCIFCKVSEEFEIQLEKNFDDKKLFIEYEENYDQQLIGETFNEGIKFSEIVDSECIPFIETLYLMYNTIKTFKWPNEYRINYMLSKLKEAYLYHYSNLELSVGQLVDFKKSDKCL